MAEAPAVGVIVVAAGSGTRLGEGKPKAFVRLGDRTILERSLASVFGMNEPAQVVVVVPSSHRDEAASLGAVSAGVASGYLSIVPGGDSRQDSVTAGLAELGPDVGIVLVHDAARPFTASQLFDQVVARVRATGDGVIPGMPVADTLKRTDGRIALDTVDRSELAAVQTPQGFPRADLDAAYAAAAMDYTDDAALFAAAGGAVHVIEGDAHGFKITTPWDLHRAELMIEPRTVVAARIGQGVDVHAYDDGVPLWLAGIYWPDEPGLAGHSDGDAVAHAMCDALLSAAGLGDIGSRFGTSDERFAGAHADVFLTETVRLIHGAGYGIHNVAVQVVGNRPRMSARRVEVEKRLSDLIGAPVSVSATTTDGLGFTGRGEGLAAFATALLQAGRTSA
jgi:2-C-methyl-D-erythritol 4-phosphate cytidylyltransferase/2-C-methyl-D-erythritol 2,4-cyclodiphosphate synthase